MMTKLNRLIKHFIIGIGFGSFFLLSIQLSIAQTAVISRKEFLIVLMASGFIGLYSSIFHSEKLNFLIAGLLHFSLTLGTIFFVEYTFYHLRGPKNFLVVFLIFLAIYVIIWTILTFFMKREIKEVNQKIADLRKEDT